MAKQTLYEWYNQQMIKTQERKRMTAVEWFNQQIVDRQNGKGDSTSWDEVIEKANKMFVNQMLEFWQGGINSTEEGGKSFDQYFNENYKK
jgi:hypothetical protein